MDEPRSWSSSARERRTGFILTRDKEPLEGTRGRAAPREGRLDSQLQEDRRPQVRAAVLPGQGYGCSACNGELLDLAKEEAKDKVPEGRHGRSTRSSGDAPSATRSTGLGVPLNGITERLKKLNLA